MTGLDLTTLAHAAYAAYVSVIYFCQWCNKFLDVQFSLMLQATKGGCSSGDCQDRLAER